LILDLPLESRARHPETTVDTIVLHATVEPTLQGSLNILRERGFSYHYLIDRDGSVSECVAPNRVAYHAGTSSGPQGEGVNEYSIGISFVNENDGAAPFGENQIQGAIRLVIDLQKRFEPLKWLTTHAAISPGRKNDPVGFPLEEFAGAVGLSVWL
jgi:N-acetyl-anhydromuramyl-L-alanine amidase AmpD